MMEDCGSADPGFINYLSVPPLMRITTLHLTSRLWKIEIFDELQNASINEFQSFVSILETFTKLREKVNERMVAVGLPEGMVEDVSDDIGSIGWEMLCWMNPEDSMKSFLEFLDSVCLTLNGNINESRTFEHLCTKRLSRSLLSKYKLAAKYCAESGVKHLWPQMGEDSRSVMSSYTCVSYDDHLLAYWTHFCMDNLDSLMSRIKPYDHKNLYDTNHSVQRNMCSLSVFLKSVSGVSYFLPKLTILEKRESLLRWIDSIFALHSLEQFHEKPCRFTNIQCMLLSNLESKEQQMLVFKKYSGQFLLSLAVDWPWQQFLLPTLNAMWHFLNEKVFLRLVKKIVTFVPCCRQSECLLKELWLESPMKFREAFIQDIINCRSILKLFRRLLNPKHIGTVRLILNDASFKNRKEMVYGVIEKDELFQLVKHCSFGALDLLLRETLASATEIRDFQKQLVQVHIRQLCCFPLKDWRKVDKLLKWCFGSEEEIKSFKKDLPDMNLFLYLVKSNCWELLDSLLGWCYDSQEEVDSFKSKLVREKGSFILVELSENNWSICERFLGWVFKSDDDIAAFKMQLKPSFSSLISGMVRKLEFARRLVHWYFDTSMEIAKFKEELFLSPDGWQMICRCYEPCEMEELIRWFHPLDASVINTLKENARSGHYQPYCNHCAKDLFESIEHCVMLCNESS